MNNPSHCEWFLNFRIFNIYNARTIDIQMYKHFLSPPAVEFDNTTLKLKL